MPWVIRKRDNEWCVYKQGEDGEPSGDALGCHGSEAEAQKQMKALHANVAELVLSEFRQHEFKGQYPDVPTYEHVDIDLLTKGDDAPFYVTLPIARVGETSANGLVYDEELVSEIEAQLPGAGGIRGHNFDKTRFPTETHDVVGHTRVGETLWAKIYVPPGQDREELRRRKARGGKIGTSIFGPYDKREPLGGGKWRARGLKLESLDFGPITRTALNLGGAFAVVSEYEDDETTGEDAMDRDTIIAELTVNDIPQTLRDTIIAEYARQQEEAGTVAELTAERDDLKHVVAELTGKVNEYARRDFVHTLDGQIAEMVKVDVLRPVVKRAVLTELGDNMDAEKAGQVLAEYLDTDEYKQLAQAMAAELSGPRAIVPGKGNDADWRDEFVKNAAQLAQEAGV